MIFKTLFLQGGPIMPFIVAAALAGYALAIERLLVWGWWIWQDRPIFRCETSAALDEFLQGAERRGSTRTPLALLLARARQMRGGPARERDWAMEKEILTHMPAVEARISTIGWLGGILPMLGLLGTVSGMIVTFGDLAVSASRQVLSQGLSEALWTTEVGLLGAVPLLAIHHLLTRLKARWLNRLELGMAHLFQAAADKGTVADGQTPDAHEA